MILLYLKLRATCMFWVSSIIYMKLRATRQNAIKEQLFPAAPYQPRSLYLLDNCVTLFQTIHCISILKVRLNFVPLLTSGDSASTLRKPVAVMNLKHGEPFQLGKHPLRLRWVYINDFDIVSQYAFPSPQNHHNCVCREVASNCVRTKKIGDADASLIFSSHIPFS